MPGVETEVAQPEPRHRTEPSPGNRSSRQVAGSRARHAARGNVEVSGVGLRDLLLGGLLAVSAIGIWLPYAVHGAFELDDFTLVGHFALHTWFTNYRPVFHLFAWICFSCFGTTQPAYYILLVAIMATIGVLLYFVLRQLGVASVPAFLAGAIVIAYPRADALGLWWTASQMGLALCLGLTGVLLGAIWIRREGRALRWLVPSLLALVASILTYDAAFPLLLLPVCLYPLSTNRRRVFSNAGLDAVVVGVSTLYMLHVTSPHEPKRPLNTYPGRAVHLAADGWRALVEHGFSAPSLTGLAIAVCIVVAAAGTVVATRHHTGFRAPDRWQGMAVAVPLLVAAMFFCWSAYIPAPTWYDPLLLNIGNHVNSIAQVFFTTALVLVLWLGLRALVARHRSVPVLTAGAVVAVLVVVAGLGGFVAHVLTDQKQFNTASAYRRSILAEVHRLTPSPMRGETILFADFQ